MNEATLIDTRPPDRVLVDEVTQRLYHVGQDEKIPLLLGLLHEPEVERAMVFVNTRQMADRLGAALEGNGFAAAVLSGDVPQRRRLALLERFHAGGVAILVATDVAARGLHIPGVTHVFNYDLPQDPEDYVHRIGRTARVGAKGEAVSLACDRFVYSLEDIEELLGSRIPDRAGGRVDARRAAAVGPASEEPAPARASREAAARRRARAEEVGGARRAEPPRLTFVTRPDPGPRPPARPRPSAVGPPSPSAVGRSASGGTVRGTRKGTAPGGRPARPG